tara:strand:- start:674 stop:892 length:219 start_codon:yes stop_codon:yes gene_type:complete
MDPAELKKNFTDQIESTDKQIKELEENLGKAKEYKLKLEGGLETLRLLAGESPDGAPPAEGAPPEPPAAPTE